MSEATFNPRRVLIIGINGAFGRYCARAFLDSNWQVSGLVRNPEKPLCELLQKDLQNENIQLLKGDLAEKTDLTSAFADADVIVYGVNPANYRWKNKAVPWLNHCLEELEALAGDNPKTLVFPGNIYGYHPDQGPTLTAQTDIHAHAPVTPKGHMRQQMMGRLQKAADRGVNVIVLRMGDFLAPDIESSWWKSLLKTTRRGYRLSMPGKARHTWAYLPDAAAEVVALTKAYMSEPPAFRNFHHGGYHMSWQEMAASIQRVTKRPVTLRKFPWLLIRALAPFSFLFRSILEMRYLWQKEFKLAQTMPGLKPTPFDEVVSHLLGMSEAHLSEPFSRAKRH